MTSFKEQIQEDLNIFLNPEEFGDRAVYTPVTGTAVTCTILIDYDVLLQPDNYDAQVTTTETTITAQCEDVGIPQRGSTFQLVGGDTFTVANVIDNDETLITVIVK